jgi:hypothetical protein
VTTYADYSAADDYDAKREGWALFECDDGALRIQRLDDPRAFAADMPDAPIFASDADAIAYVLRRAGEGSAMHMRAMLLHNDILEVQP